MEESSEDKIYGSETTLPRLLLQVITIFIASYSQQILLWPDHELEWYYSRIQEKGTIML